MVAPVSQGTLNRVRANINFIDIPELAITPSFLGAEGISGAPQGDLTLALKMMIGVAQSPEPYVQFNFRAHINRANGLGDRFKNRIEKSTLLGDAVIISDTSQFSDFYISNTSIITADELKYNGSDAGWMLHFSGTWMINSDLFAL